jgi:aryl-alcohol dehydrogenase-like predicted oxidoreductase
VRKRLFGRTGLEVSELGLGTWGLSGDGYGAVAEAEIDRGIARAVELGVTLFDTADVYGRGAMERRLGKALPSHAKIVTKLGTDLEVAPPRKRFGAAYLREAFERSRERLGREKVDVVLLHNPTLSALAAGEGPGLLKELVAAGQLHAWGVSAGSNEVARAAIGQGAGVVELAYNAFCAKDLHSIADAITEHGVAILARSVLAHGLLAGHWSAEREFYPGDHRADRWTRAELKRRVEQLDALRPLVTGSVTSLRAAALRFVLSNELVSSAVLGPRSVAQLEQLVREAGSGPPYLRDTALAELASRLKARGVPL